MHVKAFRTARRLRQLLLPLGVGEGPLRGHQPIWAKQTLVLYDSFHTDTAITSYLKDCVFNV